ncbi:MULTISPECIES: hypothetical protein [unclassified Methylobacterium]|uniref:hypothetical protein n=1 Tax=unclassified Methylobacterium TaxID=2615210 RepID=UPI000EEF6E1A|nr:MULTISPECIES: hypothetical protein [unclassified Methylobacterium]GBU19029.1 hypothetical protein AwMethylo_32440 [Methylobacterium sp.]
MNLVRTVNRLGALAVDMASVGPCPEYPDHGRDYYLVAPGGRVIRVRHVLARVHQKPGERPFVTPTRTKVTSRSTIDAVLSCLSTAS